MAWITAYGCTTAAGDSVKSLWDGLLKGIDHSSVTPLLPLAEVPTRAYHFQNNLNPTSQRETLQQKLNLSWQETLAQLSPDAKDRIQNSENLGVIFASTKGFIDDVIWGTESIPEMDTLSPLLTDFLKNAKLKPKKKTCISNACASSLAALYLAKNWLENQNLSDIIILAADAVGPFVLSGFQSLRVVTKDKTKPFSKNRSGFFLGEATAALVLSNIKEPHSFQLKGIGIDAEGYAVTRPSQSGESLKRSIESALKKEIPSVILAHGTGTAINDAVEDRVFQDMFSQNKQPVITGTKWSIGHTLAVSGALDIIVGCEVLKNQKLFKLANSHEKDPDLKCEYLLADSNLLNDTLSNFLVTSLGFGGLHAAAFIGRDS